MKKYLRSPAAFAATWFLLMISAHSEGFHHIPVPYQHKYHGICEFTIDNVATDCGQDLMVEEGGDNNEQKDVWTFKFSYKGATGQLIEVMFGGLAGMKDAKKKMFLTTQTLFIDKSAEKPSVFKSVGNCNELFGDIHSFACDVHIDGQHYELTFVGHEGDDDEMPINFGRDGVRANQTMLKSAKYTQVKYNGRCALSISGKSENCAPSITKSDDYTGDQPLHMFTTGFLSPRDGVMVLAMAGANATQNKSVTETGYDTSYAIENLAIRHLKTRKDKNLTNSSGNCLWKEAGDSVLMRCNFKSEGKSYEYSFKGRNSHDDGPLFPDFN